LAAFSSDSVFPKEKDDRNLRLLDSHHTETTETTIEGKFFNTLQLVMLCRVLAAVDCKIMALRGVTPCSLVDRYQCSKGTWCPQLQVRRGES